MTDNAPREFRPLRKAWHLAGCLMMVAAFYLWKTTGLLGGDQTVNLTALCLIAWTESGLAISIDLLRLYNPRYNRRIKSFPIFGTKIMREHEAEKFNASTYYLVSASILLTLCRLGILKDGILVMAILVLGVADPAAAVVRYWLGQKKPGWAEPAGALAFLAASLAVIFLAADWTATRITLGQILTIAAAAMLVEAKTNGWSKFFKPLSDYLKQRRWTPKWLFFVYPDDNATIPLTVALTALFLGIR